MAKKKKKSGGGAAPAKLSDKGYLSSGRARNLPIYKCLVNKGWEEMGMAHVYVLRKHANDNVTAGVFLVDTFCAGMKDSFYMVNQPEAEFEDRMMGFPLPMEEIPYELAHNIIYGAIAFAQEYGIEPDLSFNLTQNILEEDTEDVELIELEFGRNGKPVLILNPDSGPRVDYFIRQLEKHAGPGNYEVIDELGDDFDDDEDDFDDDEDDYYQYPEDWDEEEWEEFIDETEPEELKDFPVVAFHIYDKLVEAPTQAMQILTAETEAVDMKITYEPLPNKYSAEELKVADELRKVIFNPMSAEKTALDKAKEKLFSSIQKWPENPIFRNYLVNIYQLQQNEEKIKEATLQLYEKVPDYLYAKILYAQLLLKQDRINEVPAIFNNQYQLKGVYPDRDTFHISELLTFSFLMAEYFFRKGDLYMANLYLKMIGQLEIPEDAPLNTSIMMKVRDAIIKEMEPVLREAKQDEVKKLQLVAKVVEL